MDGDPANLIATATTDMTFGNPTDLILKLVILFALILVNAFFAMSEIAIITLNDLKIQRMAEDGDKKAKKILKLTENPSYFLSTIQIAITLAGFLTSAAAAENFAGPLAAFMAKWFSLEGNPAWLSTVALVVVTIIISFFSLVLGELVPKRIAMQKYEKISFAIVHILLFFKKIFTPIVKVLSFSTNIIVRLFGLDPNANEEEVTEEEIRMLVDAGEEKGVIEESQKEMINNIFEFDDIIAADVMTHRTDVYAVDISDSLTDILPVATENGYSRIPVFDEELDNIKGVLYVKDLLKYVGKPLPKSFKLANLLRPAYFFPESKRCGDLFNEMNEQRIQMAFICDEYGGIAGIVTIEDLLESIVGNMQDEYDNEEEEIEQISETTFNLDGSTDIEEVAESLNIEFPEGEYDTIAGFIMSELGRIPSEDEQPVIEFGGYSFKVAEVDERRIERVIAEKLPESEAEENDD